MNNKSVSRRLSIALGVVVLVTISIITFLNYRSASRLAMTNARSEMSATLHNSGLKIEANLNDHIGRYTQRNFKSADYVFDHPVRG